MKRVFRVVLDDSGSRYMAEIMNKLEQQYGAEEIETAELCESVTPQRPKGKWNFIGDQMFECSSCKRAYTQNQFEELRIYTTDDLLPKYCPNCGAEMSGGGEDGDSD